MLYKNQYAFQGFSFMTRHSSVVAGFGENEPKVFAPHQPKRFGFSGLIREDQDGSYSGDIVDAAGTGHLENIRFELENSCVEFSKRYRERPPGHNAVVAYKFRLLGPPNGPWLGAGTYEGVGSGTSVCWITQVDPEFGDYSHAQRILERVTPRIKAPA